MDFKVLVKKNVILGDPSEWKWIMVDLGIVAQTILLEAVNMGPSRHPHAGI